MSPVKRPSSVEALKRGVGQAAATQKRLSEMTEDEVREFEVRELATPRRPRAEKPVRFTLDLDRERHQFLKQYAASIEADASEVMRALLDELREGPNLAARVQARLWHKPS